MKLSKSFSLLILSASLLTAAPAAWGQDQKGNATVDGKGNGGDSKGNSSGSLATDSMFSKGEPANTLPNIDRSGMLAPNYEGVNAQPQQNQGSSGYQNSGPILGSNVDAFGNPLETPVYENPLVPHETRYVTLGKNDPINSIEDYNRRSEELDLNAAPRQGVRTRDLEDYQLDIDQLQGSSANTGGDQSLAVGNATNQVVGSVLPNRVNGQAPVLVPLGGSATVSNGMTAEQSAAEAAMLQAVPQSDWGVPGITPSIANAIKAGGGSALNQADLETLALRLQLEEMGDGFR